MEGDSINADELIARMSPPHWEDQPFGCDLRRGAQGAAIAVGFYEFEDFGVWSRVSKPYLIVDRVLSGEFILTIKARAFGNNIGRSLGITVGDCTRRIVLDEVPRVLELRFDVRTDSHVVRFDDVIARSDPANDDPRSLGIGVTSLDFRRPVRHSDLEPGETRLLGAGAGTAPGVLVGFHPAEDWGSWTSQDESWVEVPKLHPGSLRLELEYRSHSASEGRNLTVECGGSSVELPVGDRWESHEVTLHPLEVSRSIKLTGWRTLPVENSGDPRALGIGVSRMAVAQIEKRRGAGSVRARLTSLRHSRRPAVPRVVRVGIPATSFVVSIDGEANDQSNSDIISAFVYAFRNNPDALLFVISPEATVSNVFSDVLYLLSRVGTYSCRVIVLPRTGDDLVPGRVLDVVDVFVRAASVEPTSSDFEKVLARGLLLLTPKNLMPEWWPAGHRTVVVPTTKRPYRIPGERFGYRRNLVEVVEWDELVNAMSAAGSLVRRAPR